MLFAGVQALPASAAGIRMSTVTMIGDANNNGSIEIADAVSLRRFLLVQDKDISANADLNGDGRIDVFDLVFMKQMLIGTYHPEDYTKLVINEICASNGESLISADGSSPDWIEIYNGSDTDIHLDGYGLSDGTKKLFKYTFPTGTVIRAGGYLTVLCDGDGVVRAGDGEYLAPFNISTKKSETIYLTHPKNGTLDTVTIPMGIKKDNVYGRYRDKGFMKLSATPGGSNDLADVTLNSPVFSANGGFYDNAFNLSLYGADGEIYYTLDGSDPTDKDNPGRMKYDKAIPIYDNSSEPNVWSARTDIAVEFGGMRAYSAPEDCVDKCMIVRAAVIDENGFTSDVVSNSYFVGRTQADYWGMKVISLTTDSANLFDPDKGIYVLGTQNETASDADKPWLTNYYGGGDDWKRPANVQVIANGKAEYSDDILIRMTGASSRTNYQKSIRMYAQDNSKMKYAFIDGLKGYDGGVAASYDKLTLRNAGSDNTLLHWRDEFFQSRVTDRDFAVQGAENCIVFLDGEFWGMYTMTEKYDKHFLNSHYGISKTYIDENGTEQPNYAIIKSNSGVDGNIDDGYEFEELVRLVISGEWDVTDSEIYQRICDRLDVQSLMDYIAVETYINNNDSSNTIGCNFNNYAVWRTHNADPANPYADGKWRFMLFDTDNGGSFFYGTDMGEGTAYDYDQLNTMDPEKDLRNFGELFYCLLKNDTFRQQFYETYLDIMEKNFAPDDMRQAISDKDTAVHDAVMATRKRFGLDNCWADSYREITDYDYNLSVMQEFFEKRPAFARTYLEQLMGNAALKQVTTGLENTVYRFGTSDIDPNESTDWVFRQDTLKNVRLHAGKAYSLTFGAEFTPNNSSAQYAEIHFSMDGGEAVPPGSYNWRCLPVYSGTRQYTISIPMTRFFPEGNGVIENPIINWDFQTADGTLTVKNLRLYEIS